MGWCSVARPEAVDDAVRESSQITCGKTAIEVCPEELREPRAYPSGVTNPSRSPRPPCLCHHTAHEVEISTGPRHEESMASPEGSELSPALLKVATHVYRFPLPATKLIAFTKCFADNLGAEETSKSIRLVG